MKKSVISVLKINSRYLQSPGLKARFVRYILAGVSFCPLTFSVFLSTLLACFSEGPSRSRPFSRALPLSRLIGLVQSRVLDVIAPCEFYLIRANVTLPQK